ncbi:MAG: hypothetical protein H0W70_04120 [Actinobacteria bacterium]|nr:hypothetical protein [Actinomycetota bacterium]
MRVRLFVLVGSAAGCAAAIVAAGNDAHDAASQAWPPFVLVAGLLMVGAIAHGEGLFDALGHDLGRFGRSPIVALCSALAVVAITTALLNLDTAAAFLTPVVIVAARRRRMSEDAFLYGTLFMTNAASVLLPGSNLTNLLVVGHDHVSGATFAGRMAPAWVAAVLVTSAVVIIRWRADLRRDRADGDDRDKGARPPMPWPAALLVVATGALILVLASPAVAVFVLATVACVVVVGRSRLDAASIVDAVDPLVLLALFGVAVALGTLARAWDGPTRLLSTSGGPVTMVVAACATVVMNNLPAAALFSARAVHHPRALLLGLNLGPNLAVTGSLSAFVWMKAARSVGARPDWRRVSAVGVVLVPLSLAAAAGALRLVTPGGW